VVQYSNTKALGTLLYTQYLYPVEIAAVILLVAMIAAIALTLRSARTARPSIRRCRFAFARRPMQWSRWRHAKAPVPESRRSAPAEEKKA
jgi:NADH-quinone oxidoreductase subunit J